MAMSGIKTIENRAEKLVAEYCANRLPVNVEKIIQKLGLFDKELFVDQKKFKVMFRDEMSSTGEIKQEREANAFAAALLMPKSLLIREIQKLPFDLADEDENVVVKLAQKFEVSTQAMAFRMANLGLF